MVKNISILGSTGSIGKQTLEIVDYLGNIKVWGLSANKQIDLLEQQIRKYRPFIAAVADEQSAKELKNKIKDTPTKVVTGIEGLIEVSTIPQIEMLVTSVVGIVGLRPTLKAIEAGKHIALANKETLVAGGNIVTTKAREKNILIIPVDSEHSAIFQCLYGNNNFVKKILLTASGGPFLNKKQEDLRNIRPIQALKHPTWNMGDKISIDSATLMNKGLEVIEAKWLFNIDIDKIDVIIHPQSIIHSMVEYIDNSIIAQMGTPDMRIPIQYALTYPQRHNSISQSLDFITNKQLTFEQPDLNTFKCLSLAYKAGRSGGTMPVVLNAANEICVRLFLEGKISFLQIADIIEEVIDNHTNMSDDKLENILKADNWARNYIIEGKVRWTK